MSTLHSSTKPTIQRLQPQHGSFHHQLGVSLIELMVGLTLGLIIAVALLAIFANASGAGRDLQRSSIQIENGRYVAELLQDELKLAGFFGETTVTGATYTTPDPCLTTPTGFSTTLGFPTPVQGYGPSDALACLTSRNRKPGTHALVIRRLDVVAVAPSSIASGASQYYVQYSFCTTDPDNPKLLFDKSAAAFTLKNLGCNTPNQVRAYVSRIYYISTCNVCSPSDGVPTLKRLDLVGDELQATALVDGVEELRFEYGFDTNGNGDVDEYRAGLGTGATALWQNVMSIKVHFITRSLDKVTSGAGLATAQSFQLGGTGMLNVADDGYVRRAYSTTVRLINPSGAREIQ